MNQQKEIIAEVEVEAKIKNNIKLYYCYLEILIENIIYIS